MQSSGLKLRLSIPDTAIFKDGRLAAWFYTSRDGVVCRMSAHELSGPGLYQKLIGSQNFVPKKNPFGYVALAHYKTGVSRPMRKPELQAVVRNSQDELVDLTLLSFATS